MDAGQQRGEIITFYSYKGGTGRTMALANVACLLSERIRTDQRVLVVDWDLEAPGLHRFFPPRLAPDAAAMDLGLDRTPGLIDLFVELRGALPAQPAESEDASDRAVRAAFAAVKFESFIADTNVPRVRILRAGRNDDGDYSRRVSTFDWEGLFRGAPTIYQALGERLADMFPYVLIDSRTGVTDISGICTSILPHKLVVVFTPNRQSLTGVRELIQRATTYRRNSDDLRPLVVYPLPSRIEASLQDLRVLWRQGSRDLALIGYQPMFEEVIASAYGLKQCDLSAYFDDVQIQQTPDYAYGEEIAVRRTSDRFSLGNSYRVFVDRLLGDRPPWAVAGDQTEQSLSGAVAKAAPTAASPAAMPMAEPQSDVTAGQRVFISYSRQDNSRISRIASALESRGYEVWWDSSNAAVGAEWERASADALDASDVVVVCWSQSSVSSQSVVAEASEGLRRGVLIPVLLDDVTPPLAFRSIHAADLRRESEQALVKLIDAVAQVARSTPGRFVAPQGSPAELGSRHTIWWIGAAATIVVAVLLSSVMWLRSTAPPPKAAAAPAPVTAAPVRVPDFVGSATTDVQKGAEYVGLSVLFTDDRGNPSKQLDGIVISQSPAAGQEVPRGSSVRLKVVTATTVVPTLVGMTLDKAVATLANVRLRLGSTQSRPISDVKSGTIVEQSPPAGTRVAEGSEVNVTAATPSRIPSRPSTKK